MSWREWLTGAKPPRVACEIAVDGVAAVRWARAGQRVEAWAAKPLPEGTLRPGPFAENVLDAAVLSQALRAILATVAGGEKRVAVILPDTVARVWLLRAANLPVKSREAAAELRARLGREAAFDLTQALLTHQVFPGGDGATVLVAAAQHALVRQYEELFEGLGYDPSWVTLATLATLGWLEPSGSASELLVRRDPTSLGLAIVRGSELRFMRSIPVTPTDGSAQALFEQIYPSLVYAQDQWGEPVPQAVLVGVGEAQRELAGLLDREAGCAARELALDSWLGEARAAGWPADRTRFLAAPLGFLRTAVSP